MCMRKIMVGKMFAGGCVSSFHLTLLARHSVRRPRPLREGTEVIFEPGAGIAKGPILPSRQPLIDAPGTTRTRHVLPASVRQPVRPIPVGEARLKHFMKYC